MKIDDYLTSVVTPGFVGAAKGSEGTRGNGGATPSPTEDGVSGPAVRVTVSDKARELAHQSAMTEERIGQLAAAVASGTYMVDPMAVAQSIVRNEGA